MDIIFKVNKCAMENQLIEAGDHLLAAVSGGVDSMVLIHILLCLRDDVGFSMSAMHINHRLRGEDSEEDERFVVDFCRSKDIPIYLAHWDGPKRGENVQDAARNFRYMSLLQTARSIDANKIVLAHNLDDQAETILLNIIRGAGMDGISGMNLIKEYAPAIYLVRPLLGIERADIEKYAQTQGIPFRCDLTNEEIKYSRNYVRLEIMPMIRRINPCSTASIASLAHLIKDDEAYLQESANSILDSITEEHDSGGLVLNREGLIETHPAMRRRVLKLAYIKVAGSVAGITKDHILRMDEVAVNTKKEGTYSLPRSLRFEKKGAKLAIFKE